ncbi:hypothetical protein A3B57_01995 [Microgenomates group bacterium RIFCSPLOWO2_01_FULL_47_10]|nr:MAG: hypothetical protein A3B57_01995 [Microgenomates group bacterium RIFCSPLOWO2_01_FULL_47_10]
MRMIKKISNSLVIITCLTILSIQAVLAVSEATDSAQAENADLTQSIKDRIKKIATQSSTLIVPKRKIAFLGSVEKITHETLTLKTSDDIKLASLSAQTTFSRLPGNNAVKQNDISIGDYAVAMGFINGSQVLETKRILLFADDPALTKKTSSAGIITLIDVKQAEIEFVSDGTTIKLALTKNTDLAIQSGVEKTPLELDQLKIGQYIAAIYIPTTDEYSIPKALTILATSIIKPIEEVALTSSPSASPVTTTPPELSR